jgi:translation initiation factor 3 subunit G
MADSNTMIKTVTEEKRDDQGRLIRVTRKIRMKLVTEAVEPEVATRRAWKKFGLAANDGPGPNISSTILGEPVYLKLAMDQDFDKQEVAAQVPVVEAKSVRCRYCEGPHWSVKCPHKDKFLGTEAKVNHGQGAASAASEEAKAEAAGPAKYVPRFRRQEDGSSAPAPNGSEQQTQDERDLGLAIRISNLSDVVVESDIRDLCAALNAPVARCNVARDRNTGRCKGYAFINFYAKDDAERVMNKLNGLPYGNLILKAEIARASAPQ